MKIKKIRGYHRRFKQVDAWCKSLKSMDLNDYLDLTNGRLYAKFSLSPWSDLNITNSKTPEPKGKFKTHVLSCFLQIYSSWKTQLAGRSQPYYLKIWLFDPHFTHSQIVCAVGSDLHFYDNTFYDPKLNKEFPTNVYGKLINELKELHWEHRWDETYYDNEFLGIVSDYSSIEEYKMAEKQFRRLLKNPHRIIPLKKPFDGILEQYALKNGDVWIGQMD